MLSFLKLRKKGKGVFSSILSSEGKKMRNLQKSSPHVLTLDNLIRGLLIMRPCNEHWEDIIEQSWMACVYSYTIHYRISEE